MEKEKRTGMTFPIFSDDDIHLLKDLEENKERIRYFIECLRECREILWTVGDKEHIRQEEIGQNNPDGVMPSPEYPAWICEMGALFAFSGSVIDEDQLLREAGVIRPGEGPDLRFCTMFSPSLIGAFISDTYRSKSVHRGLMCRFVKDGTYLKMLLHIWDCMSFYEDCAKKTGERYEIKKGNKQYE